MNQLLHAAIELVIAPLVSSRRSVPSLGTTYMTWTWSRLTSSGWSAVARTGAVTVTGTSSSLLSAPPAWPAGVLQPCSRRVCAPGARLATSSTATPFAPGARSVSFVPAGSSTVTLSAPCAVPTVRVTFAPLTNVEVSAIVGPAGGGAGGAVVVVVAAPVVDVVTTGLVVVVVAGVVVVVGGVGPGGARRRSTRRSR